MDKESQKNFADEVEQLVSKYDLTYGEVERALHKKIYNLEHIKLIAKVESHKDLVGKCYKYKEAPSAMFPEMYRYIKIISYQSYNERSVECLSFYEHPVYWFDYQAHLGNLPGDYFFGSFDFTAFFTDDIYVDNLAEMTEISEEEFRDAARKYLDELLNLPWCAEHYRFGDILPTDKKWQGDIDKCS